MKRGSYCRMCASALERLRRSQHADEINERRRAAYTPEKGRAQKLRRYGISVEIAEKILQGQADGCAICGEITELVVDHDHSCCSERLRSCGQCVRGLLCSACNTGLGQFKDDPERLTRAAEYVRRQEATRQDRLALASP